MLSTACLLSVLAIYAAIRVTQHVVRALHLDVWDALVYLGLAEHHAPAAPRDADARDGTSRRRSAQRSLRAVESG